MTNSKTTNKFLEDALKQIDDATKFAEAVLSKTPNTRELIGAITVIDAAIERVAGAHSPYLRKADEVAKISRNFTVQPSADQLRLLLGVLAAMSHDFEKGNVKSFEQLVRAEVFTDFLDMADHLLIQGYKDPAAVLIGGVLEDHIKKLCLKFNVPLTEPKANGQGDREVTTSDLNIKLRKAGAYSLAEQKSIDAQLAIRNDAAHADWGKYTIEQVLVMHAAVRQFIAAHS